MKFRKDDHICPICGKQKIPNRAGHIPGAILHPACSRKMQQLQAEKQAKKKKRSTTPRMTEKQEKYFEKTGTV